MAKSYREYTFKVAPRDPATEILIAELADAGFESFHETDTGVMAYIPSEKDVADKLERINILHSIVFKISYQTKTILEEDWNAKWESEIQPILIGGNCRIRASFHPKMDEEFDIVINPKMAFGSGHHATTHLMVEYILAEKLAGKTVLDMGTGTGILSILASMKGANHIDAVDIDPWSYENALENTRLNKRKNIAVYQGDIRSRRGKQYDCIFANINRNILLNDIPAYAACLAPRGTLLMSGFYKPDLRLIREKCEANGLGFHSHKKREGWVAGKWTM